MQYAIADELEAIRVEVERLTGLRSRWNGQVTILRGEDMRLMQGKGALAEKQWSCGILVSAEIADADIRWRTLIHEMFHSVSVGLTMPEYQRLRGWEEGVVEALQRLWRPQILANLHVTISEDVFTLWEKQWVFHRYIDALEGLRQHLGIASTDFYLALLKTPLPERLGYTRSLDASPEFLRLIALASGRLR